MNQVKKLSTRSRANSSRNSCEHIQTGSLTSTLTFSRTVALKLLVAVLILSTASLAPAFPKKDAKDVEEAENGIGLPDFAFDYESDQEEEIVVVDPDETPEGQQQLFEIENRARQLYHEFRDVEQERRPLALQRDLIMGQIRTLTVNQVRAAQALQQLSSAQRGVENQLAITIQTDINYNTLQNQRNILAGRCSQAQANIRAAQDQIDRLQAPLGALVAQIAPLDARLMTLWQEMNNCRKQWLEIHVPHQKYARSEFEKLKAVINKWLRIDGAWPQAYCWASLCAFELGDYEGAQEEADRADTLRRALFGNKKWPQIEALRGLVSIRAAGKGQLLKSRQFIQSAMKRVDRDTDWETHFLAARALVEDGRYDVRAAGYLEKALEIKPNAICAQLLLANLKATSKDEKTRDVRSGTQELEKLWEKTGKRSWRMGFQLLKAYDAGNRYPDADKLWKTVVELAPRDQHEMLKAERRTALTGQ